MYTYIYIYIHMYVCIHTCIYSCLLFARRRLPRSVRTAAAGTPVGSPAAGASGPPARRPGAPTNRTLQSKSRLSNRQFLFLFGSPFPDPPVGIPLFGSPLWGSAMEIMSRHEHILWDDAQLRELVAVTIIHVLVMIIRVITVIIIIISILLIMIAIIIMIMILTPTLD